ncbi:MAG: hypothetical protein ABFS56_18565 [Pseudomonadota bacterium]
MKKQKRFLVSLVSGFILGGVSSLGLADDDCGDPDCAYSYKSHQSGQYSERRDGCAQRSDESLQERRNDDGKSGCAQRSDESLQEREPRNDEGKSGCAQRSGESSQERSRRNDDGKSGCAQRSDESSQERSRWNDDGKSGCAQRSDEGLQERSRWNDDGKSGYAQGSDEGLQERSRREREAARVQRQIESELDALVGSELDALEQNQERYREVEVLEAKRELDAPNQDKCGEVEVEPEARSGCGDRHLERNRGCQKKVVCPSK